jgi:hypothetical protein
MARENRWSLHKNWARSSIDPETELDRRRSAGKAPGDKQRIRRRNPRNPFRSMSDGRDPVFWAKETNQTTIS